MGLKAVQLKFLPPNTTSHTQPMDSGVIKNFKYHYRQFLLSKHLLAIDGGETLTVDALMSITLIKQAWDMVQPKTISNCFHQCGFQPLDQTGTSVSENEPTNEQSTNMETLQTIYQNRSLWPPELTIEQFVDVDMNISVSEQSLDGDIVAAVVNIGADIVDTLVIDDGTDDESRDEDTAIRVQDQYPDIKLSEAIKALDTVALYLAQQGINSEGLDISKQSSTLALCACKKQLTDCTV